jgi:hypothetical protein
MGSVVEKVVVAARVAVTDLEACRFFRAGGHSSSHNIRMTFQSFLPVVPHEEVDAFDAAIKAARKQALDRKPKDDSKQADELEAAAMPVPLPSFALPTAETWDRSSLGIFPMASPSTEPMYG